MIEIKQAPNVWNQIQGQLQPGLRIPRWSVLERHRLGSFEVANVLETGVWIAGPIRFVPKQDFDLVLYHWDEYLRGSVQRVALRDLTYHATYIVSILHHLRVGKTERS